MVTKAVFSYLKEREDEILGLLETLVNIDSPTVSREGVERVGDVLVGELTHLGAAVERVPPPPLPEDEAWVEEFFLPEQGVAGLARHVRGRLEGDGHGRALLLAHMDTAFPKGEAERNPFRIEGNRIYGAGIGDMKGGIVGIIWALRALRELDLFNLDSVTVLFDSDEQGGSLTSRYLIKEACEHVDFALVTEGARQGGNIIRQRSGLGVGLLEAHGRSAHVGLGFTEGVSAVEILAHKIIKLHGLNRPDEGVLVNVGVVEGGERRNLVAERARAKVDLRAMRPEDWEELERAVRRVVAESELDGGGASIRIHRHRPPMHVTDEMERLVELACDTGRRLGLNFGAISNSGGGHANIVAECGVPVLDGLGPDGGDVMTRNEWVGKESVVERTALLACLLHRLGEQYAGA